MKTTKFILFVLVLFFGIVLADAYSKTSEAGEEDFARPRRRVVYVKQHCYVRPVIYVTPKHHKKHHRRIVFIHH
ncbi:MAG: hypothetical protein WCK13_08220 [Ignavibacteriota bacterium]|nr:hypothetical protein [Ignavibacteriota bacterium]